MGTREEILARIRHRQQRGGAGPSSGEIVDRDTYLRRHPRGSLPELRDDLVALFRECAEASSSTTERIAAGTGVPAAVARYLEANRLPRSGCVWPALANHDWAGAGLTLQARAANETDAVGVTGVFCALAETGTLMVVSGPDTPATVSLLPETHVAIVPAGRIVAYMEDGWDLLRAESGQLPRAVNFISGPSRTGDIEQTIVLGAHGPYRVHIVVVG